MDDIPGMYPHIVNSKFSQKSPPNPNLAATAAIENKIRLCNELQTIVMTNPTVETGFP